MSKPLDQAAFYATGASAFRTLGDRAADVFNVKDFGALGNSDTSGISGHDDTSAIQAAINAVISKGSGTVVFPPGLYKVTSSLNYKSVAAYEFIGLGGPQQCYVVGNVNGYIFDKNAIAVPGGQARFSGLQVKNTHGNGSAIRLLGTVGSKIEYCIVQAAQFGIQLGGQGSPPNATFTGNSSGTTTLTISGCVGTIDPAYYPLFISGSGVPNPCNIIAGPGGVGAAANGTYTTDVVTTLTNISGIATGPSAPTAFTTTVYNCTCNGFSSYNSNPALSFTGVGIQLGPESSAVACSCVNWGDGIRAYGAGNYIYGCRVESSTNGITLGTDGSGAGFTSTSPVISGLTCEGNYIGVNCLNAIGGTFSSMFILGENDPSHNSTYGILIKGAQDCVWNSITMSGQNGAFLTNGIQITPFNQTLRQTFINCQATTVGFDQSNTNLFHAGAIKLIRCTNFPSTAVTLSLLNSMASGANPAVGDRFLQSDASSALGSQSYGAAAASGAPNATAPVWWDGSIFRYG